MGLTHEDDDFYFLCVIVLFSAGVRYEELLCILNELEVGKSFSKAVGILTTNCQSLLDKHAPSVSKRVSVVDTAPWFDKQYREFRKLRRKAERRAKRPCATDEDRILFKEMCVECTNLAMQKKKEYFGRLISRAQGNPRTLYQFVNKVLDRKQANPLPDYTDDLSKLANDFNTYFVNKINSIRNNMDNPASILAIDEVPQIGLMHEFQPTNLEEIKGIINEVGLKSSPADLLPQTLYKDNIDILLPILVDLVNVSLCTGNVDGVKLADIVPLLKNESLDPNFSKNFRPVSNLTFLGKLIERVVLKRLNDHMSRNNLHCNEQFAYKKGHSTETLLIRIWNDLLVASDDKNATVVMLLDLSAAFDTVDHSLLLRILKHEIGLRGKVLEWFQSFLKGRVQRIRLGNTTSEEIVIMFGVPQGSVLGPVLFNIYIRSIYKCVQKLDYTILIP